MKGTSRRPSPALIVGVLALVAAVSGTAVAGDPGATASKLNRAKVKNIARNQINKLAPTLSVANAQTANSATTAASAEPTTFAHVNPDGSVDASNSKNFTGANVTNDATGLYCIRGLTPAPRGAQVTVDYATTPQGNEEAANFALGDPFGECDTPGAQAVVNTYDAFNGVFEDLGFFIHLYS